MRSLRWKRISLVIGAGLVLAALPIRVAQAQALKGNLKVGAAKVDITPKDLTGLVGIPNKPFSGVHDHLYARALVLNSGNTTAAIVALDLVEIGDTTDLRQRIEKELSIPAANIIINASHDHSAPRAGPPTAGTSSAQGRPYSTPEYVKQVDDSIVDALRQARTALQPARMGYGTGKVDVSVARYGYTPERGWRENTTEEGYSDKTLAAVKFETPAGSPIAILFNYAVHSNSMAGAQNNIIHGDIAGNAEKFVEHQYNDKVVALWSMGAAADEYPKFNGDMGQLDDNASPFAPIEIQGAMIGGEVIKVIKRTTEMTDTVTLYAAERAVPCEMNVQQASQGAPGGQGGPNPQGGQGGQGGPGGQGGQGGQGGPGGQGQQQQVSAKKLLPDPKPGDKLDIHLGLIRLNQLAISGVSGEVGSQIFVHLKQVSPFPNNIMITLSNNRDGYIPDDAGWDHQGPSGQAFVRGCAEKAIVNNLVEMMKDSLQ